MSQDAQKIEDLRDRIAELEDCLEELRHSRDEHQERSEMLGVTLANISDPVFITDEAGAFTYVCPNVQVALGYTAEEMLALENAKAVLGTELVRMEDLRRLGEVTNIEHRTADKAGQPRDLLINIKHISIGAGTALYVCRDVTERKRTLERVRLLRDELTHVSRVTTLGEFAAGLAHELNQPLTAIANYAHGCKRTLRAGRTEPARLDEVLETIASEAERAGTIVRRLRELVRRDAPHRQAMDLNTVVRDALPLVKHDLARHGIKLLLQLTGTPLLACGDAVQIQQVVLNLIRNCCDSIAAARNQGGVIEIASRPLDDQVELTVRDNGTGISQDSQARLFEPFFTTKPEGMGMGLAISRSIVDEHGGALRLRQSSEMGAEFSLVIPSAKEG